MLSRTAENLYWMARYLERAEATARLIAMGRRMTLLPGSGGQSEWRSVLHTTGADAAFGPDENPDEAAAVRALLLDRDSPASIHYCLSRARANGKAMRTALTQEMWEALNDGWRRLETVDEARARRDLAQLLDWVKSRSATFRGAVETGMLRKDSFDFLRLGRLLECADMTLRLLNVKYYVLLPETEIVGGGRDHHQWTSVLHALSALRAYHHVYRGDYSPARIADFLLLNSAFPKSVAFCYGQIAMHLDRLAQAYEGRRHPCHATAAAALARLESAAIEDVLGEGLHQVVDDLIGVTAKLSDEICAAYLF